MSCPLVRDLAEAGIPVRLTCGVLNHSTQAYYAWLAKPVSQRDLNDAYLTNALIDAHGDDPEFGYRLLADELERLGEAVGERRVWRLCSQQKLWSATVRKGRSGAGKTPGPAVHDDHVQRDFTAQRPNQVWVTDITEHPTAQGKVYCCLIKDLFSNRIVGYAINERMTAQLAVTALRTAVARRQPKHVVIVHSDRGSQFRARSFRAVLVAAGLQGSMGRVASAGDNAAMESFNSLLQKNVFDRRHWRSRDELHNAVVHWVEHTYNNRRRQRGLGKLTPVEYEIAFTSKPQPRHDPTQAVSTRPAADPYEHREPGSLLHVDVKKLGRIPKGGGWRLHGRGAATPRGRGAGWDFVHVAVDECSRVAYSEVLPDEKGLTCAGFLYRAAKWFHDEHDVTIRRVLTDNAKNYLISRDWITVCNALQIKRRYIKPHCPWTNGKAERFNRTLLTEWAYIRSWTYNHQRTRALTASCAATTLSEATQSSEADPPSAASPREQRL